MYTHLHWGPYLTRKVWLFKSIEVLWSSTESSCGIYSLPLLVEQHIACQERRRPHEYRHESQQENQFAHSQSPNRPHHHRQDSSWEHHQRSGHQVHHRLNWNYHLKRYSLYPKAPSERAWQKRAKQHRLAAAHYIQVVAIAKMQTWRCSVTFRQLEYFICLLPLGKPNFQQRTAQSKHFVWFCHHNKRKKRIDRQSF